MEGRREGERDPECCQFAALIFQLWSVRLEVGLAAELAQRNNAIPAAALSGCTSVPFISTPVQKLASLCETQF